VEPTSAKAASKGHVLGPGGYIRDGVQRWVLAIVDLDAARPEPMLIEMGFLGHGVSVDPTRPERAAVFEKKGPGACIVDLRAREVVRTIPTAPNRHFYGHGSYSADGSLLYATESVLDDDHRGVLVVRDARTLEELGELPTYGTAPHDCMLLDDGRTMLVANGGGPIQGGAMPNVTYVDVESEALVERVDLTDPRFNAGHLARARTGDLAVVSAPRDGLPDVARQRGAVTLVPRGGAATTVTRPESVTARMIGEALSVALYEPDGLVVATHPGGDMVSMWRLPDASFVGTLDGFVEPRGVALTLDGGELVVSHRLGASVALSLVAAATRKPAAAPVVDPSFTSGSHIFMHDLAGVA
jgi:hypothetical protein